jgi:UDP-N-acetyl-D-glucosamine dehydrogenase
MSTEFIELAGKINQQMPYYCAERVEHALNDARKSVNGSRVLILGASYKGGVGDIRESPALRIMEVLGDRGAVIAYNDPYVPELRNLGLRSVSLDNIASYDAVVLVTAHPGIDYAAVLEQSNVLVDLRGITRKLRQSEPEPALAATA